MTSPTTDRRFGVVGSLAIKTPCVAATTSNITLNGEQTVDGVSCVTGDRVLVKNQTTGANNGIYVVDTGDWTRAVDFNGNRDITTGTVVLITGGTVNDSTWWEVTNTGSITIGTTALTFSLSLTASMSTLSFLQSGTGAVSRTAQSKMRDVVSVMDFGAVGDGTTSDRDAVDDAISAVSDGGIVWFPATSSGYLIDSTITLPTTKSVKLISGGVKIISSHATPVFTVSVGGASVTDPHHVIDGFLFDRTVAGRGTGIGVKISDADEHIVQNCSFHYYDIGVSLFNTSWWTEGTVLEKCVFWHCNYSVYVSKGTSSYASLSGTTFRDITVASMSGASSTSPYGIFVNTDASLYRSRFERVTIFPDKAGACAFYSDGDLMNLSGALNIEQTASTISSSNIIGIKLDQSTTASTGNSRQAQLKVDIRGTITSSNRFIVTSTAASDLSGWNFGNAGNGGAVMPRVSGALSFLREVYDADLVTLRYSERINTANQFSQFHSTYSAMPEQRDNDSNKFIGNRHVLVGTGQTTTYTALSSAAGTISAKGSNQIVVTLSSADSMSGITDGVNGQQLSLYFGTTTCTITHSTAANGIQLNASANYTSTSVGGRLYLECGSTGGANTYWWERGRTIP